jgi:sec-independent protein translocase protein TatC
MTLAEHLDELRKRLFVCVGVAMAFVIVCAGWFEEALLGIALMPANEVLKRIPNSGFISTETSEKFFTAMKVDIVAGLFLAAPMILWVLWGFVARGLHAHEKRYVRIYAPISYLLFLGGCLFFYFKLQPVFLETLLKYHVDDILTPTGERIVVDMRPSFGPIVSFFLSMMLVTGLMFELPLVMLFLQAIRICSWRTYLKYASHFCFALLVITCVITPTGDAFTEIVFMMPVLALFFGGVLICRMMAPKDI